MPYPKEIASGESLRWLERSPAFNEFKGKILPNETITMPNPERLNISRQNWTPRRVIAIDGSQVTAPLHRHFPVAEAGLVVVSVVSINLNLLRSVPSGEIPHPKIFHDMENVKPFVNEPIPGIHVVEKDKHEDTAVNFFRRTVHQIFAREIQQEHETLLDTLCAITQPPIPSNPPFAPNSDCPTDGCTKKFILGKETCPECGEKWYATDVLRLHEYFSDASSSGEAHGRLRSAIEVIVLLNLLRFFAGKCPKYLADCLFILDGPLAIFGTPASILRPIRDELLRINAIARQVNGRDVALVGIEKSGILYQHWEQLDFNAEEGPRTRFPNSTVITPDSKYIGENIKFSTTGKAHGKDTHFGRFVLYKTNKGEHVVLNTAMLSEHSQNFANNDLDCFHRLGDALDVMDELATYLYQDGFMPLIRAHANAAIPLKRGTDIIRNLFEER